MSASDQQQLTLSEHIEQLSDRLTDLGDSGHGAPAAADVLLAELESAHEELLVADEEVRAQQEELDGLVAARRESLRAQERFLSLLPVAALRTGVTGTIIFANPVAAAFLGASLDTLVGKPLTAFVDPRSRKGVRDLLTDSSRGSTTSFRRLVLVKARVLGAVQVELLATLEPASRSSEAAITWALVPERGESPARPDSSVAEVLLEMAQLPMDTIDTSEILKAMSALCSRAFEVPVAASITVGAPVAPRLLATKSQVAQMIDGAQVVAGEGPCQEAWETRTTVRSVDLGADRRWPRLAARLEGVTARTAVAVPVPAAASAGCLNLYSEDRRLVEERHLRTAEMLATAVSAVLYEIDVKSELQTAADQLREALTSRAVIDQAKGIVMARQECSADEAFKLLVRVSSTRNVKLRDVAAMLVAEVARRP